MDLVWTMHLKFGHQCLADSFRPNVTLHSTRSYELVPSDSTSTSFLTSLSWVHIFPQSSSTVPPFRPSMWVEKQRVTSGDLAHTWMNLNIGDRAFNFEWESSVLSKLWLSPSSGSLHCMRYMTWDWQWHLPPREQRGLWIIAELSHFSILVVWSWGAI